MEGVNKVREVMRNLHLMIVKNGKKKMVSLEHASPLQLEKKSFGKKVLKILGKVQLFQINLVAFREIVKMVKEHSYGITEINMLVRGRMASHMEKEHLIGVTGLNLLVNGGMEKSMDMEHTLSKMGLIILVSGRMEKNMDG